MVRVGFEHQSEQTDAQGPHVRFLGEDIGLIGDDFGGSVHECALGSCAGCVGREGLDPVLEEDGKAEIAEFLNDP